MSDLHEASPVPALNPWMIAIAVMLATFMEVLDTSIASVALPYIAGSLSATNSEATFGGVIYGLITLLPLLYQELLGYNSLDAGLAVSPRGIGAIIAMPIIGMIGSRIDNRYLLAAGFAIFGICGLRFARVDLQISQWSFLWAIIFSGFGAGMVFVPLATTSMAGLPNEEIGNASGLFNLLRNIGGSVGISLVNTIVDRHEQIHRVRLAAHVTASRIAFQHFIGDLRALAYLHGEPALHAYAMLNAIISRQARLLAYIDDFQYMAAASFLCIPVVFMLRKATAKKGEVGAAH